VRLTVLAALAVAAHAAATPVVPSGGDDTARLQAAIDGLSQTLVTGSSKQKQGGVIELVVGKYKLGGPGAVAHCAGGAKAGAVCRADADCGPRTSTETNDGYCAWLTTTVPVSFVGAGIGTEWLVAGSAVHALAFGPGSNYSAMSGVRVASFPHRTGTGKGILVLARDVTLRRVIVDGFGGDGVFADGDQGTFNANNFHFDDVESNGNGGSGFHMVSHRRAAAGAAPSGAGDASQGLMQNCQAMDNGDAGFDLRSSKNTLLGLKTHGKVGVRLRGADNLASVYCEIQGPDVRNVVFDKESQGNLVFDLTHGATVAGKYVDEGRGNQWYSGGMLRGLTAR
jgi:hypothetical protein